MKLKDTNEIFSDDLRDPNYSSGYLNISLEEDGINGFLYALQKVARTQGMSKVAESSEIPRESLYKVLSTKGNPGIRSLERILHSLGLQLTIAPLATTSAAKQQAIMPAKPMTDNHSVEEMHSQALNPSEISISDFYQLINEEFSRIREEASAIQLSTQMQLSNLRQDILNEISLIKSA